MGGIFMYNVEDYKYSSRTISYENKEYKVIDQIKNDLLLVVPIEDYLEQKFPLSPVVVPDISVLQGRNDLHKLKTK